MRGSSNFGPYFSRASSQGAMSFVLHSRQTAPRTHLKIFNAGGYRPRVACTPVRCLGHGYSDGGGLTALERARREQVRLAAADLIEAAGIGVCHIGQHSEVRRGSRRAIKERSAKSHMASSSSGRRTVNASAGISWPVAAIWALMTMYNVSSHSVGGLPIFGGPMAGRSASESGSFLWPFGPRRRR